MIKDIKKHAILLADYLILRGHLFSMYSIEYIFEDLSQICQTLQLIRSGRSCIYLIKLETCQLSLT